jgi:enoyl-CoA hydratase
MSPIVIERDGHVAIVRIDRPEKRNALDPEAFCRLADAWDDFASDEQVRAVIITGTGDIAFSAGADLGKVIPLYSGTRQPDDEWDHRILADTRILTRGVLKGVAFDKPIIAAVNGLAVGGGCELVLGTDIRVAARHATFGLAEVKRAIMAGGGGTTRVARQLPHAIAMELLLTGDPISADDALRYGLVNRVVDAADVLGTALEFAARIAQNGPLAVQAIKRTVRESDGIPLDKAFGIEAREGHALSATRDAVEGPLAFIEKRPARFEGR